MAPFLVGSHLEDNILLERGWEGRRSKAGGGLGGRAQRLPPRRRAVAGARCAWVALHFRMCVAGMWCKRRHIRLVYKVFGATRIWRYKVVRHCMV